MSDKKVMIAKTSFLHPETKEVIKAGSIVVNTKDVPKSFLKEFKPGEK